MCRQESSGTLVIASKPPMPTMVTPKSAMRMTVPVTISPR